MANSILSSLFTKAAFSVTDNATGIDMLKGLKVQRVRIRYASTAMRHPMEDGTTKVDSRVIRPALVEVTAFIPNADVLAKVNKLLQNRENLYTLKTRGVVLPFVMAETESLSQVAEVLSATPAVMHFKQLLIQNVTPVICAQASDSSVIDKGLASVKAVAASVSDTFSKLLG